jgi:hypothetical protein
MAMTRHGSSIADSRLIARSTGSRFVGVQSLFVNFAAETTQAA